ncbi:AIPR family protein [Nitrospirillum sp. BR 11164]|uniref:AIPR family protein n=1 Tax=Nitrospirillum sp. BR 11164 TaxID=3104324 RepID=UPI002AFFD97C|nr:AIPR family protein [Nitrospirillum sp. BR 11164]MEA1647859.1 AIPR family protein [Nitrospirillum sp. BR 11164]
MHRIVKAHLDSYVRDNGLEAEDESSQFEKFVTHAVVSSRFSGSYEIDDLVTGEADDGIDGIAVVIDEEIIISAEDANSIFATQKRNHDVDIIFTQAKRTEGFDLGDFLKFKEAILRFITQNPYTSQDAVLQDTRSIFEVVLREVPKIRNGKPSLTARFVTTGIYQKPAALETALRDFSDQLAELGLFAEADIKFVGRDELTTLWVGTYSGIDASLELYSNAPLPKIAGIDEAYLAVVKASDFVENLLLSSDGNLRTQVFEENVRSFLGLENPVNASICATIRAGEGASRFPVLNNGITIASPDVRLQGNTLHLKNFQIVNGCQTSNVLFESRHHLGGIMVNVKVVETNNEDVFSELVRATNSQTKVEDNQFFSLRPVTKRIEQYFNSFSSEGKIYFERRDRQYVGQGIPALRIFSLQNAAKCVAAMFLNRPELSLRYPKTMYDELGDILFAENTKEVVFYAACLAYYRLSLLISNSTIPQNMKRFKWHMLALVRASISGKDAINISSRAAEKSSEEIIRIMAQHGPAATDLFSKIVDICRALGEVSPDRLKRQLILQEMLGQIP